jgi:hypothetical protein
MKQVSPEPKRGTGAKTGGKDRGQRQGQRQGTEKIGCHILLTSPIIARSPHLPVGVKPYGNFSRLFIFATVAFHSLITEFLALPKLWFDLHF